MVSGSLRATDTLFSTTAQFQILRVPTSSNGTTFGPGSTNNLLKSNGTSVYWTTLAASDIPNLSTDKLTSGTLSVARGGTGASTATGAITNLLGDSTSAKFYRGDKTWSNELANYIFNTTDIPEEATNLSKTATAHKMTFYRNGITIPYQMDNPNDGGILRVRGTSESNCIFELGTWDDSGAGETIQFNYYPTTSPVTPTYSVSVPKASGTICLTNGTGASGTWGINISGNAATATKATQDADGNTISSTYLKLSGGTMTGNLIAKKITIEHISGEQQEYRVTYGSTVDMSLMVGTSNENHGIYDSKASKWMIYADASGNVTVNGNAATATKATQDGSGNNIENTYLKMNTAGGIASCDGGGSNWYYKVATIKITSGYINRPIVFEISGREHRLSLLQVMFYSVKNSDPNLHYFTTNDNSRFWIKKTTTSTWEIYGKYNESWGNAYLHRITGCGADIGVTVSMTNAGTEDSIISGATRATYLSPLSDGTGATGTWGIGITGNASAALGIKDAWDSSKTLTIRYYGSGVSATDWIPFYDGSGNLVPVSSTNLANKVRDKASGSWNINAANVTGTVAIGHGGTGATTASAARVNLGLSPSATGVSLTHWVGYDGNPRLLVYGGTLCVLHIGGYTNAAVTRRNAIMTIPESYCPAHEVGTLVYNASANSYAYWNVKSNGIISSETDSAKGHWFAGTLVWFANK